MDWNWKNTALMGAGTKKAPIIRAGRLDPRCSYYVYLPEGFQIEKGDEYSIAVVVHGTARKAEKLKDSFVTFADNTKTVILAPLFPTGIIDREDIHNYKFIKFHDMRFDEILLDMVDEVRETFGIAKERFLLYGFSGGGQFAHRMFYLHPERLLAVGCGAPGRATYLDFEEDWYAGVRDFEEQFGRSLDLELLKTVPVLLLIGEDDTERIDYAEDSTFSAKTEKNGKNRVERMESLYRNYLEYGLDVRMRKVPGVGHEGMKVIPYAAAFFEEILQKQWELTEGRSEGI